MLPKLIALCGAARHGKTTAANYLEDKHGYVSLNFSSPLKDLCIKALLDNPPAFYINQFTPKQLHEYNRDREAFWWDKMHTNRDEFSRWVMQFVGTDIVRAHDHDHWVKLWSKQVALLLGEGKNVVAQDMRFLNEALQVTCFGGLLWRVVRTDADAPLIEAGAGHASELEYKSIEPDATVSAPFGIHFVHEAVENLLTKPPTG